MLIQRSAHLSMAMPLLAANALSAHASPRMRAPMTYVIDYSRKYLDDDANIEAFRAAPPGLMHVGKSVPILHNWGAAPLISGENQFTGGPGHTLDREAIRLLTPEELARRIDRLKAYTKKWHDIGVPLLVPYSSFHTIAGDHEKREGFWRFFDHWEDYAKWLGPKPTEDPFGWLMVGSTGTFVPGACGGYSPAYFAPLHRYRVCPEHPEWRKLQQRLTGLIAEVGYDGVFPDNSNPENLCFCKYCQASFRRFVASRSPRELQILGVAGDPGSLSLLSAETPTELIRRYRLDTSARYQRMVRDAGRKVNPNFVVFPNVNSYREFMPLSDSCDFLMFESTYSPGCSLSGKPPEEPFVTIDVGDADTPAGRGAFQLAVRDERTFVELSASIGFPRQVRTGQPAELTVKIDALGSSNQDGDWGEEFAFVLVDLRTKREERVPLTPAIAIGGGSQRPNAKRPPVELKAAWTPEAVGRYKLCLAYRYSDESHLDVANELQCRHDLNLRSIYKTHIGQLLYTMHARARTVLLDYECRRAGKEPVMELGLAECAAFSNGSALASRGAPRVKYAKFFRRTKRLYEGLEPYADIGLMYSYWGHNPLGMGLRPGQEIAPSVDLAGRHRPIKVVLDRTLDEAELRTLTALILCGHSLEMTDAQLASIRQWARSGGKLFVYRPETTINGEPFADALAAAPWEPGTEVPGMPPLLAATGFARGLRFSAFTHPAEPRLTLHVLNYNVAHSDSPAVVTEVTGATVVLPLPVGFVPKTVRVHDPDSDDSKQLSFEVRGGSLVMALPAVRIYRVVEVVGSASLPGSS